MSTPNVTPADIEDCIASEHYFMGQDGANGAHVRATGGDVSYSTRDPLCGVQFCVLVLKNGHIVTGEALLQDLSKPDPERARASARRRAFDKAYDMVVYAERERLAAPPSIPLDPHEIQSGLDRVRWAEGLIRQLPATHDGRNSWLLNYGTKAETAAVLPLYVKETWDEAAARVPAILKYAGCSLNDYAAEIAELLDTIPGYSLQQVIPWNHAPAVFLFRRNDGA